MNNFFKILLKSSTWTLLTTFVGLLQVWISMALNCFTSIKISYGSIISNGSLLFFVAAIVTTITIDFYFSKIDLPKLTLGIMFCFFPIIILCITVAMIIISFCNENYRIIDLENMTKVEYAIIFMTLLYAISGKYIVYDGENKKDS